MKTTNVFSKNLEAYQSPGKAANLIINQGGSSSSKTYSILQLLYIIALYSARSLRIHIVSRSLPHLKQGAMADFDEILINEGYIIDDIKNKTDNIYRIGRSFISFYGVEDKNKVHGPRRDILYINECNHVDYEVYRQLSIRTNESIFLDYNPTRAFWVHERVLIEEQHRFIKSTYLDNEELNQNTIDRLESHKNDVEWWRVYGLGEIGRLQGAIFKNWEFGSFDWSLPNALGLDFGVKDPDAMLRCAIDRANKKLFWKEEIYKIGNNTEQLAARIRAIKNNKGVVDGTKKLIIADSSGKRTIDDLRDIYLLNIKGVKKNPIVDDVKLIKNYQIIVDPDSKNLERELSNWEWLDKKGEVPIDVDNHLIDAGRYITQTLLRASGAMANTLRHGNKSSRVTTYGRRR